MSGLDVVGNPFYSRPSLALISLSIKPTRARMEGEGEEGATHRRSKQSSFVGQTSSNLRPLASRPFLGSRQRR